VAIKRFRLLGVPFVFCLGGLILAHHEMVLHGFNFTQNDLGDTRLITYVSAQ
jgi:hypothetical protein